MKYIQNTYSADIQIVLKKSDGRFLKNIVFTRYQLDRMTGQVVSDGYTEVEDEDLALLQENGAFKLLVDKKKLVVKDEAPLKAGSFEQMLNLKQRVADLEAENAKLKAENAELKASGKGKPSKKGAKAAEAKADGEADEEAKDEE